MAGCGDEAPGPALPAPPPVVPAAPDPAPAPPAMPPPGVRRPAGEVPPRSRTPFDGTAAPAAGTKEAVDFTYAVPGPPGVDAHYHVRFLEGGTVRVDGAGPGAKDLPATRFLRTADHSAAVKALLPVFGKGTEVFDPASSSGCDAEGHGVEGARRAPPVRVLRVDGKRISIEEMCQGVEKALAGHRWQWAGEMGDSGSPAFVDLHLVGE